jgi:hypothetical protein
MVNVNAEVIASLTTATGTLVLAIATFGATRSANKASRFAERSLLAGLRPLLMHAELGDGKQKIGFSDQHWIYLEGPQAAFDLADGNMYLAISLRNVGNGIAVLQGWYPTAERLMGDHPHASVEQFRLQTRDLYIAAGSQGFWQGAFRDSAEPGFDDFVRAAKGRTAITIELLYTDMHGGQRTITRFSVMPAGEDKWLATVSRHWMLDGVSPR